MCASIVSMQKLQCARYMVCVGVSLVIIIQKNLMNLFKLDF